MTDTRFAANGPVRLAYELRGREGPWVALVHGLGYGRWGWEPVVDALAESMRVVLFDNRGIGASDVPEGPYSAAAMAGDVVAILDEIGVRRACVVGASLGGMIAQELALAHPGRVDRLVLVGTTPGVPDGLPMPERTVALLDRTRDLDPPDALRALVANALAPAVARRRPDLVERIVQHRLDEAQSREGWEAQAAAGLGYEGGRRQERIAAPTLVLHGDADAVVDSGNGALLAAAIPAARLVPFPGCGHLLFWEEPERFVAVVRDFLLA